MAIRNSDKARNAEIMFGTGSKQYQLAVAKYGEPKDGGQDGLFSWQAAKQPLRTTNDTPTLFDMSVFNVQGA